MANKFLYELENVFYIFTNVIRSGFFKFFAASKSVENAETVKSIFMGADDIVFAVTDHKYCRLVCNIIFLKSIGNDLRFCSSSTVHLHTCNACKVLSQMKMINNNLCIFLRF